MLVQFLVRVPFIRRGAFQLQCTWRQQLCIRRSCVSESCEPPEAGLSSKAAQVADFAADPLNFVGNVRAKTANEILKGFREVQRRQTELRLPLLALHGTADHITSYPARPSSLSPLKAVKALWKLVKEPCVLLRRTAGQAVCTRQLLRHCVLSRNFPSISQPMGTIPAELLL